jgi:hypothetical protein
VCAKLQLKGKNVEHLNHVSTINLFLPTFQFHLKSQIVYNPKYPYFCRYIVGWDYFNPYFCRLLLAGWVAGEGRLCEERPNLEANLFFYF